VTDRVTVRYGAICCSYHWGGVLCSWTNYPSQDVLNRELAKARAPRIGAMEAPSAGLGARIAPSARHPRSPRVAGRILVYPTVPPVSAVELAGALVRVRVRGPESLPERSARHHSRRRGVAGRLRRRDGDGTPNRGPARRVHHRRAPIIGADLRPKIVVVVGAVDVAVVIVMASIPVEVEAPFRAPEFPWAPVVQRCRAKAGLGLGGTRRQPQTSAHQHRRCKPYDSSFHA
jgi:hypothetical protein